MRIKTTLTTRTNRVFFGRKGVVCEKSCIFAASIIRALDGQVGGRQDIVKDVERNVLSAAYRTSQLRNLCRTVKQQPSSIGAIYMVLMYSRQRGLRHCLSSTKGQCEGLIRGMSDELRYPRFFFFICILHSTDNNWCGYPPE